MKKNSLRKIFPLILIPLFLIILVGGFFIYKKFLKKPPPPTTYYEQYLSQVSDFLKTIEQASSELNKSNTYVYKNKQDLAKTYLEAGERKFKEVHQGFDGLVSSRETAGFHNLVYQLVDLYLEALTLTQKAVEHKDADLAQSSQKKLQEAERLLKEIHTQLSDLYKTARSQKKVSKIANVILDPNEASLVDQLESIEKKYLEKAGKKAQEWSTQAQLVSFAVHAFDPGSQASLNYVYAAADKETVLMIDVVRGNSFKTEEKKEKMIVDILKDKILTEFPPPLTSQEAVLATLEKLKKDYPKDKISNIHTSLTGGLNYWQVSFKAGGNFIRYEVNFDKSVKAL